MVDAVDILCWAASAGALAGAGAYIYGYILKPRGDRRWHTASLLFSGFGLANLPLILREGAAGPHVFNGAVLVIFLMLGMGCQIAIAFRQRKGDRRAADRADVPQTASAADLAPPLAPAQSRAA